MKYFNGILSCIGNTPLIKMEKYFPKANFSLYGKLEMLNPGGSIKDRPALKMLLEAFRNGVIDNNSTIIESSSGNMGIGLAQACAYLGLKFICVTDSRSLEVNRKVLHAYGATVDLVEIPDPKGGFLAARLKRVKHLLQTIPNSFNCHQYTNLNNPYAHYQTVKEVLEVFDNQVDYIFIATSTCGTLRGCAEFIHHKGLSTKVIGVDAKGSIIFGDKPQKRLIPGHGAAVMPPHYQPGLEDDFVLVSDLDCVTGCRQLVQREGIFLGGSSGAIIAGIEKFKPFIPLGATVVGIFADRGDRYLDTIYSDKWVKNHFGSELLFLENSVAVGPNEFELVNS